MLPAVHVNTPSPSTFGRKNDRVFGNHEMDGAGVRIGAEHAAAEWSSTAGTRHDDIRLPSIVAGVFGERRSACGRRRTGTFGHRGRSARRERSRGELRRETAEVTRPVRIDPDPIA